MSNKGFWVVYLLLHKMHIYSTNQNDQISHLYFISLAANPCDPNPCKNGGHCSKEPASRQRFNCSCKDGYVGETCEIGKIWVRIARLIIVSY